jgi:hypothetical protein
VRWLLPHKPNGAWQHILREDFKVMAWSAKLRLPCFCQFHSRKTVPVSFGSESGILKGDATDNCNMGNADTVTTGTTGMLSSTTRLARVYEKKKTKKADSDPPRDSHDQDRAPKTQELLLAYFSSLATTGVTWEVSEAGKHRFLLLVSRILSKKAP